MIITFFKYNPPSVWIKILFPIFFVFFLFFDSISKHRGRLWPNNREMRVLISSCGSVENPFHERYASPNSRATIPIIILNFYTKTKQIIIKEKELLLRERLYYTTLWFIIHLKMFIFLIIVYIGYIRRYMLWLVLLLFPCTHIPTGRLYF